VLRGNDSNEQFWHRHLLSGRLCRPWTGPVVLSLSLPLDGDDWDVGEWSSLLPYLNLFFKGSMANHGHLKDCKNN